MNIRRSKKNKISYSSIYILIALLIIILCMIIFIPSWSSKVSSSAWDGVVATSFSSGNGTEENPYQISSAGEFAYFKELLQSEDATLYSTKEYVITNSFNYGGYDISINNDIAFTGTVNGKGNIISNAVITNSLFKNIESSTIENINFQKIKLNVNDEGAFLALNAKECNISFLAIEEEINTNDNSKAAGLVFNDESSNFQKILINQTFTSSTSDNKLIAYSLNNTSIDTILNKEDKYENYNNGENVTINNSYNYKIVGSKIKLNDEESISKFITKEYVVNINKDEFIFVDKSVKKPLKSQSNVAVENTTFELHESGIENNTVYINDLEADFNYYDALNYTETGGTLPTFTSLNKYNTSNMVRVMITYDASDGNNTASISLNETENKMVYYKWVPVINNSVRIKLIENPFTNRPNNKGFNNWVSRDDNVVIDFDETLYERYATIPVTKVNNKYEDISVYFNASWVDANVAYISSNNWNSVFDKFDNKQMNKLNIEKVICDDYDMSGYYFEQTAGYFEQYQGYDNRGNYQNTWCWSTTCTYYTLINNENYDSSKTYYELVSGRMRVVDPSNLNLNCETIIDEGYINRNMAGYYVKRNFSYNASYTGYYNNTGQKVTGTCNSSSCTYYELLQTGDNEIYDSNETYYYLVTRDINIAVLNGSFSGNWSRTNNKPFTFTGLYNGVQTSAYWKAISSSGWNSYTQTIYEDTTIENMKIYSTTRKGIENPLTDNSINANYNNLKLGRGITANGNYVSVSGIIGGSSSTSGSNDVKYNIIIESGIYNSASLTYYATSGNGGTIRTNATLTLGNDYDRVTGNNSNLDFNYCVGGSWGGRIYSSSESGINTIVKSGTFGSSKYDLTTGIYVGGRYGGTHYTARTIKVEGGFVYNLIGGPLTASSRSNVNDTYIYQTGGEIDMITGGAGQTATYGNRIIALTGGKVNYSVFAGSNGSTGSGSDGTLNGTGFIYIGGSAVIGDEDLVNNGTKLYGSEAGSVFGIGNGRSGYSSIGSSDNANILITGSSVINNSVYGGGNYGATGVSSNNNSSYTKINITGGTIKKDVYGGSNENGTVNDTTINIENGNIENIYGGNNKGGTTNNPIILITNGNIGNIYGGGNLAPVDKTLITINSGTIQNIYGGGNEASVLGDTKVDINGGTFNGNIYGGGNYGRVIKNALVTISDANITGSAYAGGNGQTAIVEGNTTIEIDGNTIIGNENTVSPLQGSVFGGGNAAATGLGSNNNSVGTVNIAGGKIYGNVYGGANTSVLYGNSIVNIGIDAINSSNANPVNYNPDTKVYSTDEVEVLFNETFMNTTGGYWDTFLTLTNKLNVGIQDYSLVLYTGSNKLTQCYNCNFTIEGDYTYITPIINWEGQTTMNANESYALNGSWDLTDPSKIYVKEYYSDKSDMYNESSKYKKADIYIKGTIFGGGEANASGSENYDYSFISVTKGINILIDANRYDNFDTYGSIFGSGNASSTSGESKIEIKNYGNINNPHKNISIQRTNDLIIDNSNIVLSGAKDRTNEYSDVLFSLSIIDVLRLKNNSALFLENGANLLKKVESLTKDGEIAKVNINDENKTVDKNVDNRIYLLEGRNLNIATNESVTSYGEVYGMTFLGMFTYDRNNNPNMGIYKPTYNYGDTLSWGDMPIKGSYALGLHKANHDIEKDGFYSNFMDDETSTNIVKYVEPTPKDSNFYMWIIGEAVIEYNINLVASKYSTLGAEELTFLEFSKPNTSFQILGFDYSLLLDGVNLKEKNQISKQASTEQEANNNYALVLEPSNQGWLTRGSTTFKTSSPNIVGDTYYMGDSTSIVPSLLFYLYHSKNITESRDLGTVSITVMAITAIDPLTNETRRLVINIDLSTALYQTNEYEAAMAPGDKYNLFTSTTTNITTNSKFSVYYALYGRNTNLYKEGYHRALVSSYAFPEKTKITMLDIIEGSPRYYYHIITKEEEENAINDIRAHNETSYDFSLFTTMGSIGSSKNYSDTEMNQIYYHNGSSDEEFIFIVDFSEANIPSNKLNNSLLVELRNNDDQTIVSVLGIQHEKMRYSLYKNSESVIEAEATIDKNPLYIGNNGVITVSTNYQNLSVSSTTIYDTQYFDSKLGLKITFYDKSGNKVSGNGLMGAYFSVDGKKYYPNVDGTTRIKIADKVGNAKKWIIFNTENASIATGDYTITIETFGSPDGIYYGDKTSSQINIPVTLINSIYGLKSILDEKDVIINTKDQVGDKNMKFVLLYDSGLSNPSLRMTLYRRKYDNVYDTNYEQVDLNDYVDQLLFATNTPNEYILTSNPEAINEFSILLKNNILTGTYRLEFKLYDNDTLIGTVKNYIIIK